MKKILLISLLFLSGCSLSADKRVVVKPKQINTNSREFCRALAIMIKQRYKTEPHQDINWIMAELELAKYKMELE
jgi:hypothetical protein